MTKWICTNSECKHRNCMLDVEDGVIVEDGVCQVYGVFLSTQWKVCDKLPDNWYNTQKTFYFCDEVDDAEEKIKRITPKDELPDWCKVGEWVYAVCYFSGKGDYCKIREIKPGADTILEIEGHGADFLVWGNHIKQARLRPYNAKEMRGLVGKVLEHDGNASLVIVYLENGLLRVGTKWVSAERLIEGGYTIDGKPCGKLEHLEDGEWVE